MGKKPKSLLGDVEKRIRFYMSVRSNLDDYPLFIEREDLNRRETNHTQLIELKRTLLLPLKRVLFGPEKARYATLSAPDDVATKEFNAQVKRAQIDLEKLILQEKKVFGRLLRESENTGSESRKQRAVEEIVEYFGRARGFRLGILTEIYGENAVERYLRDSNHRYERKFEVTVYDILGAIQKKRDRILKSSR